MAAAVALRVGGALLVLVGLASWWFRLLAFEWLVGVLGSGPLPARLLTDHGQQYLGHCLVVWGAATVVFGAAALTLSRTRPAEVLRGVFRDGAPCGEGEPSYRGIAQTVILAAVVIAIFHLLNVRSGVVTEDSLTEWLQAVLFLGGAGATLWAAIRMWRWRANTPGAAQLALGWTLVGLAVLFVGMEELSWGQRVFGWETPGSWRAINRQDQTNLHNLLQSGSFQTLYIYASFAVTLSVLASAVLRARRPEDGIHLWILPHPSLLPLALLVQVMGHWDTVLDRLLGAAIKFGALELQEALGALFTLLYGLACLRKASTSDRSTTRSG